MLARLRRAWAAFWAEPEPPRAPTLAAVVREVIVRALEAERKDLTAQDCDRWLRILHLLEPDA
jgi:hypothetical protein